MNILCIGDIVGKPGREAVEKLLPGLKAELALDLVIANAENAAGGSGLTESSIEALLAAGCDVITSGDHIWDRREIYDHLDKNDRVLRPANFPKESPGRGFCLAETARGEKIAVINLLGRVFIRYNVNCPFRELERLAEELRAETKIIVVDFHGEATSEKIALGYFADGKVSAVFGTHTHVQTADERILPHGTGYITDVGMTGPFDSVIGQNKANIIERFLKSMPVKFEVATDDVGLNGVVFSIDPKTGSTIKVQRIQRRV